MAVRAISDVRKFALSHHLEGLTGACLRHIRAGDAGYTLDRARHYLDFQARIARELLNHRVITNNPYTAWFRRGGQDVEQVRALTVQFSVFSNQFLVAQLRKVINADSLEGMRASKEILANEIGVVFNAGALHRPQQAEVGDAVDPELVSTRGTVEGGIFHFRAAHFEWLMQVADALGLEFGAVGQRRHGTAATLHFCDELARLYGSEDYRISQAASYAVENWASAGFWDELIEGLRRFNRRTGAGLPLAFFAWHARLEAQHARHTQEELESLYFTGEVDEAGFIRDGNEMLDAVAVFWEGLDEQRRRLAMASGGPESTRVT
ncbi:MAG: hypothetical protein U9R74_12635 [Pseudomonadota bacterium]|nr:hypothetical protein [Pseudomonadota bacterium]